MYIQTSMCTHTSTLIWVLGVLSRGMKIRIEMKLGHSQWYEGGGAFSSSGVLSLEMKFLCRVKGVRDEIRNTQITLRLYWSTLKRKRQVRRRNEKVLMKYKWDTRIQKKRDRESSEENWDNMSQRWTQERYKNWTVPRNMERTMLK